LLGLVGCAAFIPSMYALLAVLYTILVGMVVVYYWKPWVLLYTLLGIASIATVTVFASGLLSRTTN